MKVLIIYAHPGEKGFSLHALEKTEALLLEKKVYFETVDLYREEFDPALNREELYTRSESTISSDVQRMHEKINETDGLVFIYPVWWGGMPAILKGFVDRVFTPGFAFKYNSEKFLKFIPDKLLDDKKILVLTSSGAPRFLYLLLGEPIKMINKFFIFGLFTPKAKTFQVYNALSLSSKKKREVERNVVRGINWLCR